MKKHFLLLLLSSAVFAASAQDNRTPYMTRSLASDGIKNVFVNTSGGSIAVAGGQEPRLEVYVVGNNNQNLTKEEIKKRLDEDYTLEISVHDGELHATAKQKRNMNNWRRSLSIGFKVYVNKQAETNLNTSGGSISLDNLTGNQNFETSGGSLNINNITGVIRGETSGGSINLSNSKQDIKLNTSGGSITANNCSGKISLETSGGSLRLNDLKGNIHATTSGGSINGSEIDGELITGTSGGSVNLSGISGSLDASTSGGSVHAQMVRVGKYVKLESSSGHIDLSVPSNAGMDLDLRADRVNYGLSGTFNGEKSKDKVIGKVNGGGGRVEIRGDNSITISSAR
ncbi:DUF4097 domain-containing protein [Mucilaginibacter sp.]|uniref:DUF4097 family beta strand repeat-containing protein n=1 Tax=Mucilaginibacter sp. TaxID=1882438 RepID=UPI0035BC60EA